MIFPWMFDELLTLRNLKDAAHLLAEKKDWPPLYNINSLNNNKVSFMCLVLLIPLLCQEKKRDRHILKCLIINLVDIGKRDILLLAFFITTRWFSAGSWDLCVSCFVPPIWFQVPVAAAVYYEDMFVNFKLSMETAAQIAGIRLWITNEFMHSGLRDSGSQVLDHLLGMLNGRKPLF